jgi:hypothetical protein
MDLPINIFTIAILTGLFGTFSTIIATLVNIILKTNKQKTLIKIQTT